MIFWQHDERDGVFAATYDSMPGRFFVYDHHCERERYTHSHNQWEFSSIRAAMDFIKSNIRRLEGCMTNAKTSPVRAIMARRKMHEGWLYELRANRADVEHGVLLTTDEYDSLVRASRLAWPVE